MVLVGMGEGDTELDLKLSWVGGSLLLGVGGCPRTERAGEGRGSGSLLLREDMRSPPHGMGSHQVRLLQVTGLVSQDRSSTTSSLPNSQLADIFLITSRQSHESLAYCIDLT